MDNCFLKKGWLRIAALDVGFAAFERLDQFRRVFRRDFFVKRVLSWSTPTSGPSQQSFMQPTPRTSTSSLQAGVLHRLFEVFFDGIRIGGHAAGGHAAADDRFFAGGPFLFGNRVEIVN